MLKQYLQECLEILDKNSQKTELQKFIIDCQNNLNPNDYSQDFFESLQNKTKEPMQIAIIGQFSSGKSTFLNALLGQDILPTGITPITSKVCKICYGEDFILEVLYKDGNKVLQNIHFLKQLTRQNSKNIDSLCLYAPILMLKEINFLDTPGFNSQNHDDTKTTLDILKNVDGIIWLTLIDNAGKNSEKKLLQDFIKHYSQKTLCILNQKDRLKNEEEIQTSLQYANESFKEIFSQIIPISAKMALQAQLNTPQKMIETLFSNFSFEIQNFIHQTSTTKTNENSFLQTLESSYQSFKNTLNTQLNNSQNSYYNDLMQKSGMPLIFDFLNHSIKPKAKLSKEYSALKKLKEMHILLHYQYHKIYQCYTQLIQIFKNHLTDITLQHHKHQENEQKKFNELYTNLDLLLDSLAQFIFNSLEQTPTNFPKQQKRLFIPKTTTHTKNITTLPLEKIKISLQNPDSPIIKDFKSLSAQIKNFCNLFANTMEEFSTLLHLQIKQWQNTQIEKQEFYKYAPNNQSLKELQNFSQQYYENLFVDFNTNNQKIISNLQSELIFLSNFIVFYYDNAIESTLNKIDLKIKNSLAKHRENPDFPIFIPSLENIRDSLNETFCFEHFQTKLFGPMNLLKKSYSQFLTQLEKTTQAKISLINSKIATLKIEIDKITKNLHNIKQFKKWN